MIHTNTLYVNRFCALIAILILCGIFVQHVPKIYEKNFNQLKLNIEDRFATPPKEKFLKNLFWDYLQITNRNYVNGNIIMNDGRLITETISDPPLLEARAELMIELSNYLQTKNTPFLFIRAPDKMRNTSDMPKGYENTVIEDSARFMEMLENGGVNTLDLREEMTNDFTDWSETFFWGDHHWNTTGALWAYGKLGELLNRDYGFYLDEKTWNMQEYEMYRKTFVGSESKQVAMMDEENIALIPTFRTDYIVTNKVLNESFQDEGTLLAEGNFLNVFFPQIEDDDNFIYERLNYQTYGLIKQYQNLAAQEDKKVLLIGDSFSSVFATYLSTGIKNVDYLNYFSYQKFSLFPLLKSENYDLVMCLFYDGMILRDGENIVSDRMYFGKPVN